MERLGNVWARKLDNNALALPSVDRSIGGFSFENSGEHNAGQQIWFEEELQKCPSGLYREDVGVFRELGKFSQSDLCFFFGFCSFFLLRIIWNKRA